ncbi:MAG: spore cortex-lytic enzyme [Bacillaceae bacterium]|nr:spore cortex-lytic enzyme [Bacillaceae bacterium]
MSQKTGIIISLLIVILVSVLAPSGEAQAVSPSTLYDGSTGGDVWDLQYRLSLLGYYQAKLDGVMGWQTVQAVRHFQRDYGLTVDGIVGPATWNLLKKVSLSRDEVYLVARAVYGEARGEPYTGQVAVAAVIMNRIQSPEFPNTAAGVIFQKRAFTAVDDGQFWYTPNALAIRAVKDAVRGWDPTGGALYYFNPATATSSWIWTRPQITRIGNHVFTM